MTPPGDGAAVAVPVVAAADVLRSGLAPSSRRAYDRDWVVFAGWCARTGHRALPAEPVAVARFVTEAATAVRPDGRYAHTPSSLSRMVAGINFAHRVAGVDQPGASVIVKAAMRGVRRDRGTPPRRMRALMLADLEETVAGIDVARWPVGVIGRRDRAMLLLGWTTALRASSVVALRRSDLTLTPGQGRVVVRRSKTDQDAAGAVVVLPPAGDPRRCVACAVWEWIGLVDVWDAGDNVPDRYAHLAGRLFTAAASRPDKHVCRRAGEWPGDERPLFRPVRKAGAIGDGALGPDVPYQVVKRRRTAAGLDASGYGSHSLRAGFVTTALQRGIPTHRIMRQTLHTDPGTIEVYARHHAPELANAAMDLQL
jgi:integrase